MDKVLIGSKALEFYGRLRGRQALDFDLLVEEGDGGFFKKENFRFDIHLTNKKEEPTTKEIFLLCKELSNKTVIIPHYGEVLVAPLSILKVLKLSSLPLDKAKHYWDLKNLEDVELSSTMMDLVKRREQETKNRREKEEFFNKTSVFRIMDHDRLHEFVNPSPVYLKIINHATQPQEDKFNLLTLQEKNQIIFEECLVLSLERWLIPKMVALPYMSEYLGDKFLETSFSNDPALIWLSRLSLDNKVLDNPLWISSYIRENYEDILTLINKDWNKSVCQLPESFWKEVLTFTPKA